MFWYSEFHVIYAKIFSLLIISLYYKARIQRGYHLLYDVTWCFTWREVYQLKNTSVATLRDFYIHRYIELGIRVSCKKRAEIFPYCGVVFALIMYRFCISNALYSAILSFKMLPFLLTAFNTWDILYWAIILNQFSAWCCL